MFFLSQPCHLHRAVKTINRRRCIRGNLHGNETESSGETCLPIHLNRLRKYWSLSSGLYEDR